MKNINCYIHIPFCNSKCKYCRFASFSGIKKVQIQAYVDFLCKEIENSTEENLILDTIYFGGGTPGVLELIQFDQIFSALRSKYIFNENIEISIETTPLNITKENIIGWKKIGINRISMGLQTLNDKSLTEIGRDNKGDILTALDNVLEIGFQNFSIDFIIGLPFVKKGEIVKDIDFLLNKYDFIKHVSVYMLEEYYDIPEDKESKFENITYPDNWNKLGLNEEDYLEEYINIKSYLESKNLNRYEISNYAKAGFECKHNYGYWTHKETIAFGLGAFGYLNNIRYSNSENFLEYYNKKNIKTEKIEYNDIFLEEVMFGLRTNGLKNEIVKKLDTKKINYFINNNYLEKKDDRLIISDKGVIFMDYILGEII